MTASAPGSEPGPARNFDTGRRDSPRGRDLLLASMGTAVVVVDETLAVGYMNSAAETLFGLSERQALGHRLDELMQPSSAVTDICRRALATGLTFGIREFATRVGTKPLLVDCRAGPIQQEEGLVLELNDTYFDRRVRQEAGLIAQQKLSRRILRQLAHEIKNPLGGMRGAAQLLQRKIEDADLAVYTKIIVSEVDRLAALVDNVLNTGGESRPEIINPHEITETVANLLEVEKPPGIAIIRDYDPSLPKLAVDRDQMIQAVLNVARNALQALGESGNICIRTRANSNVAIGGELHRLVLCIEIEDNGPGIPDELQETVFYPLVSGHNSGSGLGLTIAQDLVSRNRGLIEFSSEPGRTVFQIRIPIGSAAAAESPRRGG